MTQELDRGQAIFYDGMTPDFIYRAEIYYDIEEIRDELKIAKAVEYPDMLRGQGWLLKGIQAEVGETFSPN